MSRRAQSGSSRSCAWVTSHRQWEGLGTRGRNVGKENCGGPGWAASMPPDGEDAAFGMSRVQGGAHQFLAHPWLKE